MRRRLPEVIAGACLLLALVSCGPGSGAASSGTSATADNPAGGSGSATALAESLRAAGLCADASSRQARSNVAEEVRCSAGQDDVIIRAFITPEQRDQYLQASGTMEGQLSFDIDAPPRLVGPTWIVTTDTRATADKIRTIIGGELR